MGNKIRVTNPPEFYAHYLKVGEIHDITGHTEHGVEINHDYFLYNHEFEWTEESHESKLSLDEETFQEVIDKMHENREKLKEYQSIVRDVHYYEISAQDATEIIMRQLKLFGYDIGYVRFDSETQSFKAGL